MSELNQEITDDSARREKEIRKQLHDMSNALTVLVGKAELLAKLGQLTGNDKAEIDEIVQQGYQCFSIIERARKVLNHTA